MRDVAHTLDDWAFELPPEAIAQQPVEPRDMARLLRLKREDGQIAHHTVSDLATVLPSNALLVMNETRVVAARLVGHKQTGGRVEMLLARPSLDGDLSGHEVLFKSNKQLRIGTQLKLAAGVRATVVEVLGGGRAVIDLSGAMSLNEVLQRCGAVPLPPYIRGGRERANGADRRSYQCVYARNDGAVAAPTAGLHFTESLLARVKDSGIQTTCVTLHVGPGTFLPVRTEDIRAHRVLPERFEITQQAADTLNAAKQSGRPIIAVGTTTTRVLESNHTADAGFSADRGETALTILPGHKFSAIDGLMTNFHLPRSSLLFLVGAFCGRERVLAAYREAVEQGYRFYSYGDAMLIV